MAVSIPIYPHRNRKWFFIRKGIFQIVLPSILALASFFDYLANNDDGTAYSNLYFYTTLVLITHASIKSGLEYIFDICSDITVFRKPVDLERTVPNIILVSDLEGGGNGIIVIKKIFKLRYSSWPSFVIITQVCWFLGLDCPILVPFELVKDMNVIEDEELSLQTTLDRIYNFQPSTHVIDGSIPVILRSDQKICDVKRGLFG